jgi:hypothetical protein
MPRGKSFFPGRRTPQQQRYEIDAHRALLQQQGITGMNAEDLMRVMDRNTDPAGTYSPYSPYDNYPMMAPFRSALGWDQAYERDRYASRDSLDAANRQLAQIDSTYKANRAKSKTKKKK